MADKNETIVTLKLKADLDGLKEALRKINDMIRSTLKAQVDITFNIRGEKRVEALKQRIAKEIKVPVSFHQKGDAPKAPVSKPTPQPTNSPASTGIPGNSSGGLQDFTKQMSQIVSGTALLNFSKNMTKGIMEVGVEFENLKTIMRNTLGGTEEGDAAMDMIKNIASNAHASIGDVGESFQKLVQRGMKPTEEEFIRLNDFARSQGKNIGQWTNAVTSAMLGQNRGLKKFGITAKDAGGSVIYTFRGVSTQVKKSEKDIYEYLLSLGKLDGIMGMSGKSADTFSGKMQDIRNSIDTIKITIFEKLQSVLKPLMDIVNNVLDKIKKWVEENPELVTGIVLIITTLTALVGAFMVLTPIISSVAGLFATFGAGLGWIIVAIAGVVFVIWDLWNGFTTGNSIIADLIVKFLEWIGITTTAGEVLNFLKATFDILVAWITAGVTEMIAIFQFMVDYWMVLFQGFLDFTAIMIDIVVALFTGNIPRASEGFERLKDAALNIFDKIVLAAQKAVKTILNAFVGLMNKLADIPLIGEYIKKGANGLKGVTDNIEQDIRKRQSTVNERDKRINGFARDGKNPGNLGGTKKKKNNKKGLDIFGKTGGMFGSGGNSGGGSKGKKNKDGAGKSNKQNTEGEKAIVTAIESLQDILKKTGYSITSEIKRANLFEAKRKALLDSQKREGVTELFKHIKERVLGTNNKEINNNNKVEIFLNGSNGTSYGINANSRIADLFKIQNKRRGG